MESTTWPENFPDIAKWSFERTWKERPEFCKFAMDWTNPTGLFEKFQKYCLIKIKTSKNECRLRSEYRS